MDPDRWDPEGYLDFIRTEIPDYDHLQVELSAATRDLEVSAILDLGAGTGETARRVVAEHPGARLVGLDESAEMLAAAERALDGVDASFEVRRLEDPPPPGAFDLVVSALAVHHLDALGKAQLFAQVHGALRPGGRFALGDVVLPERPGESATPTDPTYDRPSSVEDQLAWLRVAGFTARVAWRRGDLAVLVADRPRGGLAVD